MAKIKTTLAYIGLGLFIIACALSLAQFNARASDGDERILVKYKAESSEEQIAKFDKKFGSDLEEIIPKLGVRIVSVPANLEREIIGKLKKYALVEYAEPDALAQALFVPNDPYLPNEWGLVNIHATNAWDVATGTSTVKIAILDTGIDYDHGDLKSKVVSNTNFTASKSATDRNGHGTHVAGIAAATTNNARGVASIGYSSSLMNVKVLSDNGSGYYSWIANGIIFAADNGAKVINMSLGGSSASQTLQDAIDYAWSKGVVIVAAAGNNNNSTPSYPAYYAHVIAVGATDENDSRASFSNFGDWVDVAAPGVNILSTYPHIGRTDRYAYLSGTSMASPFVAGLAALVWNTASGTDNQTVRDRIENTADTLPTSWTTHGLIDAAKAVTF